MDPSYGRVVSQNYNLKDSRKWLALGTSYLPGTPGYLSYSARLDRTNLTSMENRRKILVILTAIKLIKGEMDTSSAEVIKARRINHAQFTRRPTIFEIQRGISNNSPLNIAMSATNGNRNLIDLDLSSQTIKENLRNGILIYIAL